MTGQTFTVAVPDGRRVEVLTAGPAGGLPLVMHNGTPVGLVAYPPMAHGAWLAAHVPGARAHLLPGEGHLTLGVTSFGAILDDLCDLAALGNGAAPGADHS